jgi:hypothetical protein
VPFRDFLVPLRRQRDPLDGGCLQLERIQHVREDVGHRGFGFALNLLFLIWNKYTEASLGVP